MLAAIESATSSRERSSRTDYDYLIVGRGRPGVPEGDEADAGRPTAGYERLVVSDRFILLEGPS